MQLLRALKVFEPLHKPMQRLGLVKHPSGMSLEAKHRVFSHNHSCNLLDYLLAEV
jgi:hypothetical protein